MNPALQIANAILDGNETAKQFLGRTHSWNSLLVKHGFKRMTMDSVNIYDRCYFFRRFRADVYVHQSSDLKSEVHVKFVIFTRKGAPSRIVAEKSYWIPSNQKSMQRFLSLLDQVVGVDYSPEAFFNILPSVTGSLKKGQPYAA